MDAEPLSRALALRIGLAARALPDIDPATLMQVLDACVGRPFSEEKLNQLTPKRLRLASSGLLSEVDGNSLREALRYLKGEEQLTERPAALPQAQGLEQGEMPHSVRVAVASNESELIDGHFGSCARFLIYQVSKNEMRLIDVRSAVAAPEGSDDKNAYRAELVADCHLLYVVAIGGPAAAKVIHAGVHPIKCPAGSPAKGAIGRLQEVLAGKPPPWLAKGMQAAKPRMPGIAQRGGFNSSNSPHLA